MQDISRLRLELDHLKAVLRQHDENCLAGTVEDALNGSDATVIAFLHSNELWGGSGSIADQAGLKDGRTGATRSIEAWLIQLGEQRLNAGITNIRTATWVEVLRRWQLGGI